MSKGLLDFQEREIVDTVQPEPDSRLVGLCVADLCSLLDDVGYKSLANDLQTSSAESGVHGTRSNIKDGFPPCL